MKFLANENVPFSSVTYLKSAGFDIKAIGIDNPSIADKEVIDIAIKEERTILTYDKDYGELIFKHGQKPNSGVIFIRQQPVDPLETAKIIEQLVSTESLALEGKLTVIDANTIRQKGY